MKRLGIGLLELIIGIAIASLVMIFVYQSFFVAQRTSLSVETLLQNDISYATVQRIMSRDISGAHVVLHPSVEDIKKQKEDANKQNKSGTSTEIKNTLKPIQNQFVIKTDQGKSTLTFITNNVRKSIDPTKPHSYGTMRIWYFCKEDPQTAFTLFRAESPDIEQSELKQPPIKAFPLLGFITKFEIEAYAPVLPTDDKKNKPRENPNPETSNKADKKDEKKKEEPSYHYKKFIAWPPEEYKALENNEKNPDESPATPTKAPLSETKNAFKLPHFVIIRITQHLPEQTERTLIIPCMIDAYAGYVYDFNHPPIAAALSPQGGAEKTIEKKEPKQDQKKENPIKIAKKEGPDFDIFRSFNEAMQKLGLKR